MKIYLIYTLIGLVSGFLAIIPLLNKRADKYSVLSTFVMFFMVPYIISHIRLPWAVWWWKGIVVAGALALPLSIMSMKGSSRCAFSLLLTAMGVGAFISFLEHYLL